MVGVKEEFEGPGVVDARWWRPLPDGRIQCDLCPRDCRLHEGQRGPCVRAGSRRALATA